MSDSDQFREVSPLKTVIMNFRTSATEEEEEGLDSIGDLSERTIGRLTTSTDRLAEALRRESFSSISSLGTRQQFTTALDNLRSGLLGEESQINQPVTVKMDSPSDLSPNAPPTGFEDPATYFGNLQGQAVPAANNGTASAEGSVDSSGFEKVEHDLLDEYGHQFANQLQQSVYGQLPEDPDTVAQLAADCGFELVDADSNSMNFPPPVVHLLKRIPGDIDKPYPANIYDVDEQNTDMSSSPRDDVIEKDYSTGGLIDIPRNNSPPAAAQPHVEQGDLLGDFEQDQAVPQHMEPAADSPPPVPERSPRYKLDDDDEVEIAFNTQAQELVDDAVKQAQHAPELSPRNPDENLAHQEFSQEPLRPEPAHVEPHVAEDASVPQEPSADVSSRDAEPVRHVPAQEEEPMQAAEYDEPAYDEAIRHESVEEPSPKHAVEKEEKEDDITRDSEQLHDEVEDMLSKLHENDNFQEMVTDRQPQSQAAPAQDDVDKDEPDFRSQTPEETTYERHGPLTIPELPEKVPATDDLLDFQQKEMPSPGFHGHHGFETVPRPPTPPKSLSDEDVQPAVVDLGHGSPPHQPHHDRHHSILKNSPHSPTSGEPWFNFESVDPRILELIYWRDPKKSAVALSLTLIALFVLAKYPLLSVIAYTGLAVLAGTLGFRVFKVVESQIKKTGGENPFQEYLAQDLSLPQERVHAQVDVLVEHSTVMANQVKKLVFVESIVDSVKFGLLLWSLTYIASWFSGFALVILAVLAVFSLPKVYETYQEPIDAQLEVVCGHIKNVTQLLEEKLPFLKRAQAVEEEKKDQ